MMLSIGRTSSYAIAALSQLAASDKPWVHISELASAKGTPGPYLAKLLHMLTKAGLVQTKRGYKGGYALARPASELSVLAIIEAVEGPEALGQCLIGRALCSDDRACPAHEFWKSERQNIRARLATLTLEAIVEFERGNPRLRQVPQPVMLASARSECKKGKKRSSKARARSACT